MQTVAEAIRQTKFYSDEQDYWIVKMPPNAITVSAGIIAEAGQTFCGLLVDRDEVTLILRDDVYDLFKSRLRGHQQSAMAYRLITFDIELDLSLVGFIAHISETLADAQIPLMVYAAYSRDHVFVPATHFDRALTALQELQSSLTES